MIRGILVFILAWSTVAAPADMASNFSGAANDVAGFRISASLAAYAPVVARSRVKPGYRHGFRNTR